MPPCLCFMAVLSIPVFTHTLKHSFLLRCPVSAATAQIRGSGNVFSDLGRPDAEARLLKTDPFTRINKIICQRGLKQVEAAKLLGLFQPDASRLLRGSFREYCVERLLRLLTVLDLFRPEAT